MFSKIFILLVFIQIFNTTIVLSETSRERKIRRRNMVVNMRPNMDNDESIFGRIDVSNDVDVNKISDSVNPNNLEELAHKIGQYLFEEGNKPTEVAGKRSHKRHRKARSNKQNDFSQLQLSPDAETHTLVGLENRLINPLYIGEEYRDNPHRTKRN